MNLKYNIKSPCKKYNLESKGDGINYHCASCQKNVKDLTSTGIIDLVNSIQQEQNTCVKILPNQLNIINKLLHGSKQAAIYASALALMASSCNRKITKEIEVENGQITIVEGTNESISVSTNTIKGKVIDLDDRGALIGASIILEGTDIGTATDIDGSFFLEIPHDIENDHIVLFQYIGYKAVKIKIENIRGKEIIIALDAGILIGYIELNE